MNLLDILCHSGNALSCCSIRAYAVRAIALYLEDIRDLFEQLSNFLVLDVSLPLPNGWLSRRKPQALCQGELY